MGCCISAFGRLENKRKADLPVSRAFLAERPRWVNGIGSCSQYNLDLLRNIYMSILKNNVAVPGSFTPAASHTTEPSGLLSESAIVYCENHFGSMDGKTANGLVRFSQKYRITAVVDSEKAGQDAGEVLDGKSNGIPICRDMAEALLLQGSPPQNFIIGMAPAGGMLSVEDRAVMFQAMEQGMNLVNGLHEFLSEDESFVGKALSCNVQIFDVRKPKKPKDLTLFDGSIFGVKCPRIAVLGTDTAIGKRTTATILAQTLQAIGLNAVLIGTGQTSRIQGFSYGVAIDAIPAQFAAGEIEAQVVAAYKNENPDVMIIEGQGALSHPAYSSSSLIIRGTRPDAIILQHAPMRKMRGDFPRFAMPTVESEIHLLETFSEAKVIGITLNHEEMSDNDLDEVTKLYEAKYGLLTTDATKHDPEKLVRMVLSAFPALEQNSVESRVAHA